MAQGQRAAPGAAQNGWVLMPKWQSRLGSGQFAGLKGHGGNSGVGLGGCEFLLGRPKGGSAAIEGDLRYLPRTLCPLLGRSAVLQSSGASSGGGALKAEFELVWGRRQLTVGLAVGPETDDPGGTIGGTIGGTGPLAVADRNIAGVCQVVNVTTAPSANAGRGAEPEQQCWVFLSRRFRQQQAAVAAFAQHTRKTYPKDQQEELTVFFEVDRHGRPRAPTVEDGGPNARPSRSGVIHSTLPTKLLAPMGAHLQSSWLLSIDRQDVQALSDNAWNAGLL